MPHKLVMLAYPGFQLLDVSGPAAVFDETNRALSVEGLPAFYDVDVISPAGGLVSSNCGVTLQTRALAKTPAAKVDTLLVMGAYEESLVAAMANPSVRRWLPRCARMAERFGSVCSGTFILASLGLLDGKRVATHWDGSALLAQMYPSVIVDADKLYVVDGKVWTSAGVSTGIDMALAMVEHDVGASIASQVAKRLVLYARRPGYQTQFSALLRAQVQADDHFADLISWIQENLDQPLDVPILAERVNLTERSFYRKFTSATGSSPARFIETLRLEAARTLLSNGHSLKEIAEQVGYLSPARLTVAFERRLGLTPRLFREMHAGMRAAVTSGFKGRA